MRDPKERLRDILDAIAAIERYLDYGRAALEQDELLQGWFVRNLQIIGEAARALPDDVRAPAPDIEWPKIIGMRNVLVHGYLDIDTDLVWGATSRDTVAPQAPRRGVVATPREAIMRCVGTAPYRARPETGKLAAASARNLEKLGCGA
jgi:uncharacterized protein with HEPN domain